MIKRKKVVEKMENRRARFWRSSEEVPTGKMAYRTPLKLSRPCASFYEKTQFIVGTL